MSDLVRQSVREISRMHGLVVGLGSDPAPTKRRRYLQEKKNHVKNSSAIIGVVTRRGYTVVYVAETAHIVRTRSR